MNENQFIIEKDIALKPQKRRLTSPLSISLRQMEVGDSILMNQRERNAAFAIAAGIKIKLASRRLDDAGDQIRVWRIA